MMSETNVNTVFSMNVKFVKLSAVVFFVKFLKTSAFTA